MPLTEWDCRAECVGSTFTYGQPGEHGQRYRGPPGIRPIGPITLVVFLRSPLRALYCAPHCDGVNLTTRQLSDAPRFFCQLFHRDHYPFAHKFRLLYGFATSSAGMLDWRFFPHIFDRIYEYLDADGVNVVRVTCTKLRARVETDLWEHITLSHKILMSSSSNGDSRPEAVLYTKSQTYSARYGCPLPRAFQNGHPQITKTVNVVHPPGTMGERALNHCENMRSRNDANPFPDLCSTANHLWDIGEATEFKVAVQILRLDTYSCMEIRGRSATFESCINAYSLQNLCHKQAGLIEQLTLSAPHQIFNLTYPGGGLDSTWPIAINTALGDGLHTATIILRPDDIDYALGSEPALVHSTGIDWFVERMALAAQGNFCSTVTFVAVDHWPPEGPQDLSLSTPQTTVQAFKNSMKACETVWRTRWPGHTKFLKNVEIIEWGELRERVGDAACHLLASVPPPGAPKL